jgi:hypothetical protein
MCLRTLVFNLERTISCTDENRGGERTIGRGAHF